MGRQITVLPAPCPSKSRGAGPASQAAPNALGGWVLKRRANKVVTFHFMLKSKGKAW